MASAFKFNYHRRLFVGLVAYSILLLTCFAAFQYHREKQFKAEELNLHLQGINSAIIGRLDSLPPSKALAALSLPRDLRLSLIDTLGHVVYDNTLDSLPGSSHLDRTEIVAALRHGEGYTLRRHSATDGKTYFYAAQRGAGYVVRTAMPYDVSLDRLLSADYAFLWFMIAVTVLMCVGGYFATRRIGRHVARLNRFAEAAERGEHIYGAEAFPHDELGDISSHIVRLYARLQQVQAERDKQHEKALFQEREKIRIKRELTNNINHELKTPVAAMQMCLETLDSHPDMSPDKRREFINRSLDANRRLQRLLCDVASLTRIEEGAAGITSATVDLSRIVREICSDLHPMASQQGIVIINEIPPGFLVKGNDSLIDSIFRNLIDNAIKYSGGSEIRLSMPSHGRFTVSDNGHGVAEEHLPHLFERFYRIDKGRSRRAGGTGLGLAIVRNAVTWHGGYIRVTNRAEGGLQFDFSLIFMK